MHNVISVKNLSKTFGGHQVLNNFSAEIPLCGVTVIRGASGAGKTTLFRLLLGLEKPDSGEILGMQGRKPAVVFQEDRLLPWSTALENAALGSHEQRAKAALIRLGTDQVEEADDLGVRGREFFCGRHAAQEEPA